MDLCVHYIFNGKFCLILSHSFRQNQILCVCVGQFNKVQTLGESLEHISAFNPGINPISPVEAAVDDSLIQADTERDS